MLFVDFGVYWVFVGCLSYVVCVVRVCCSLLVLASSCVTCLFVAC